MMMMMMMMWFIRIRWSATAEIPSSPKDAFAVSARCLKGKSSASHFSPLPHLLFVHRGIRSARLEVFFSTCWRWRCQTLEEVWNISIDRPSDPVIHPWAFTNNPHQCKSELNQFLPYGAYYFYKASPRDQPALHSLGWPSLKPQRVRVSTSNPPLHVWTHGGWCESPTFVAATRSITHTACHTSWRWGCTPLPRSPCTLRPESTGFFFGQRGVRESARWGKGFRHSVFFVGLVLICPHGLTLYSATILGSGPCSLPECLSGFPFL